MRMHAICAGFLFGVSAASAGEANVLAAERFCTADFLCRFTVTVRHDDNGWDHYANRWEILSMDGEIIATRVLEHPHDNEQPFTRSLNDVRIPKGVLQVRIRAHDSVHGYGGAELTVELSKR